MDGYLHTGSPCLFSLSALAARWFDTLSVSHRTFSPTSLLWSLYRLAALSWRGDPTLRFAVSMESDYSARR